MKDFDKICKDFESIDVDTYKAVLTEKAMKLIPALSAFSEDGMSGVELFASFIYSAIAADGKLSEDEYALIYPLLHSFFGDNIDYADAKRAFSSLSKEHKELKIIVDDMEKTISKNDRPNLYKLHSEWTEKIVELSSNEFLKSQINVVYENLERLRSVSLYKWEHMVEAYNETENILEAIIDGDEVKAEKLARTHVINAKNRFIENMSAKKD